MFSKTIIMWGFIYVGLIFPDLDLKAIGLLHHRSILTHSLLLPLLLLPLHHTALKHGIVGLCIGTSIHLSADALSPMKGFALIYLPEPFKVSIGGWQSLTWLLTNSVIGGLLAVYLMKSEKTYILLVFTISALSYSILNENSTLPMLPCTFTLLIMYKFNKGKYCQQL